MTGYPSIDKPWLKYYTRDQLDAPRPVGLTAYEYLTAKNQDNLDGPAITYRGNTITYQQLFDKIDHIANALLALGVREGEILCIDLPALPEEVYLFYAIDKIGAVVNFVFPDIPDGRLCDIINEVQCKRLFLRVFKMIII